MRDLKKQDLEREMLKKSREKEILKRAGKRELENSSLPNPHPRT
jgi:cell division protein FtsL